MEEEITLQGLRDYLDELEDSKSIDVLDAYT